MNRPEKPRFVVAHLEDDADDRTLFSEVFQSSLLPALEEFFEKQLLVAPPPSFELVQIDSVDALVEELGPRVGRPTESGKHTLLLVLDHFVPKDSASPKRPVVEASVRSVPFTTWLSAYFGHIPVLQLTVGQPEEVEDEPGWHYENKAALQNPTEFARKLGRRFKAWWIPYFADALRENAERGNDSWHTPGHNRGNAFSRSAIQSVFHEFMGSSCFDTDLSVSVSNLGDLSEPQGESPLENAQSTAAEVFGSEETFFVTNGTSTSNKCILMSLLRSGDHVLLDRNYHKSVHQAVVMADAIPIYLSPEFNHKLGVWAPVAPGVVEKMLSEACDAGKQPRLLALTTCTYEGLLYPIRRIADLCEQAGVLFFADEAWAPYLRFHPSYVRDGDNGLEPYSAIAGGAHFAVHSTHKALAAFSQSSMIHISGRFRWLLEKADTGEWEWLQQRFRLGRMASWKMFRHKFQEVLRYWYSTSPYYPMLATLDRASIQMRIEGVRLIDDRIQWVHEFESTLRSMCGRRAVVGLNDVVGGTRADEFIGYGKDPLKLVLHTASPKETYRLRKELRKYSIQWEKASSGCIEFLVSIGTFEDHIASLKYVLNKIGKEVLGDLDQYPTEAKDLDATLASGQVEVVPRDAAMSVGEVVPLSDSVERISAQMVVPYPPGIPVILPGLRIKSGELDLVQGIVDSHPEEVHGLLRESDGTAWVRVMTVDEERAAEERFTDEFAPGGEP